MLSRSKLKFALTALPALALAIPALSLAGANTVGLVAQMKGGNEVPGPGAPKGSGDLGVQVKPTKGKLCFTLEVKKLDPLIAGHIHKGAEGDAGPVKVTLFEDDQGLDGSGSYEGCVKEIKENLLDKIIAKPETFYANIHTKAYPDGAVRGQLEVADD
jgi:hypothetical protein